MNWTNIKDLQPEDRQVVFLCVDMEAFYVAHYWKYRSEGGPVFEFPKMGDNNPASLGTAHYQGSIHWCVAEKPKSSN
jgi:hypothetical protein